MTEKFSHLQLTSDSGSCMGEKLRYIFFPFKSVIRTGVFVEPKPEVFSSAKAAEAVFCHPPWLLFVLVQLFLGKSSEPD